MVYPGKQQKCLDEEDKIAPQDLLWVNEECKCCALPDKGQQPENCQETEGTLRKPQMQSAVAAEDKGVGLR